jgi:mannose-6-phosphate isomerase-like protein (cupin superfamily)
MSAGAAGAASADPLRLAFADAAAAAAAAPVPFAELLRRGDVSVELFAPRGRDDQRPHAQDELYFVVRGSGLFRRGGVAVEFGPGDALFVAAGVEHRFESFTDDIAVWVVFFGPRIPI